MHVRLVKNGIAADSRCVEHGGTPDCIEVTYDVRVSPQPDNIWLSFFYDALKRAESFALRDLMTKANHIRFTCRGDEVEYAFEALKRLFASTNAVYYHREPAVIPGGATMVEDGVKKRERDRAFVERAKQLL